MERQVGDSEYHMSLSEIAEELGVTRQYVWDIQNKALKKLRVRLREWEGYERDECDIFGARLVDDSAWPDE